MISTQAFKAVVNLNNMPEEVQHIKRLALIFDEVYYIHPQVYVIEKTVAEDHTGKFQIDFLQDCTRYTVITQENLRETLSAFEEVGLVKSISSSDYIKDDIGREIAILDARDPEFVRVSQTSNAPSPAQRFKAKQQNGPEKTYTAIEPPNALTDSFTLTNTLYVANRQSLFPVFLNSRHRQELQYRYDQYQQAAAVQSPIQGLVSPDSFGTRFGEITFKLFRSGCKTSGGM